MLPETDECLSRLAAEMRRARLPAIRAFDLSENMAGDHRVLHVELNRGGPVDRKALMRLGGVEGITGLTAAASRREPAAQLSGVPYASDELSAILPSVPGAVGHELRRHAAAFFQGNRYLLCRLASAVVQRVPDGAVTDLYAGVGLFAVGLAAAGRGPVVAVERDRIASIDLRANASAFPAIRVTQLPVETYLERRAERVRTLIVDPPRTGLSRDAATGVIRLAPECIVYVSCDPATLARDMRKLLDAGYSLGEIEAFDLFPNTAHVEVVVVLTGA